MSTDSTRIPIDVCSLSVGNHNLLTHTSSSLSADSMGLTEYGASAICWAPILLFTLYCAREQHIYKRIAHRDITLALAASLLLRLIWFAIYDAHSDSLGARLVNRLSILMQSIGVLMLLFMWIKGLMPREDEYLKFRNATSVLFSIVWFIIFVLSFLGKQLWYRVNLICIAVVSFFIAFMALCYGLAVQHKMKLIRDDAALLSSSYSRRKKIARKLILVSAVLSVCFGFRAMCFAFIDIYMPNSLFPWLYYHVSWTELCYIEVICDLILFCVSQFPELVPLAVVLAVLAPEYGVITRILRRGSQDSNRFTEDSACPRPTSNSIRLTSVVMDLNPNDMSNLDIDNSSA